MTIIVEDGTLVPDAESYISVQEADQYHNDRGMTMWPAMTTQDKERALRRATDFMVARYRGQWKGYKVRMTQALDWPRNTVVIDENNFPFALPYNTVPKEVKRACADLALKAASGPLAEDATQKVIQETVGPITTKYDSNSPVQVRYVQVDAALAPFLKGGGNSAMVTLARC